MATAPPRIFSPARRRCARARMLRAQADAAAARFLLEDMVEDTIERIGFLRVQPARALVIGDHAGALTASLRQGGAEVTAVEPAHGFDEERPYPEHGFDLVASLSTLDTVNDLPGALLHIAAALAPGGLMLASVLGAGSLPALRAAMLG